MTQFTYSAGVTSPIISVRLRINVLRFRPLSILISVSDALKCRDRFDFDKKILLNEPINHEKCVGRVAVRRE